MKYSSSASQSPLPRALRDLYSTMSRTTDHVVPMAFLQAIINLFVPYVVILTIICPGSPSSQPPIRRNRSEQRKWDGWVRSAGCVISQQSNLLLVILSLYRRRGMLRPNHQHSPRRTTCSSIPATPNIKFYRRGVNIIC